jgi:hypothetical protein
VSGRDALSLKDCKSVEIVGLGQDRRHMFLTTDLNFDLFDAFVVFNPYKDQMFWLLVRLPGDHDNRWTEADLASVEYFLKEDFNYDDFDVECELEFGEGFPRSVAACWCFSVTERSGEEGA